jgi:hypothetical protein
MEDTQYTIGYIDEDAQQVKKFQRSLRPFGFSVVGYDFEKNMTPESLMEQVYDSDIDLLMIDYKLKESNIVAFNGDVIENLIYQTKPLFPHIIFTSDTDQAEAHVEDLKIIFDKGDVFSEDEDEETDGQTVAEGGKAEDNTRIKKFVKMLKGSIQQYKSYVDQRKQALSGLLEKGEKEGLNANEKNEVLTLQSELINLDQSKKGEIPKQLITADKLEELAKTRIEAEEFLASLIKKNENDGKR